MTVDNSSSPPKILLEPTLENLPGFYEIKVETITSENLILYEDIISVEVKESLVVNFDEEIVSIYV